MHNAVYSITAQTCKSGRTLLYGFISSWLISTWNHLQIADFCYYAFAMRRVGHHFP